MVRRVPSERDWCGLNELRVDVERALARTCRDRNELDDMVQETLLRAATFRGSLHDHARLRPWVLRIGWNVMRDHLRRERRYRRADVGEELLAEMEGRESGPGLLTECAGVHIGGLIYDNEDVLRLLESLLPQLSEVERSLFDLYYSKGLGCRRSADRLDVTTQTVKMRLFRLRRKLRRRFNKQSLLSLTSHHAGARIGAGTALDIEVLA